MSHTFSPEVISEAAERFGTPLYLYDLDYIAGQYAQLRAAMPGAVRIHYAMKANSNLSICAHLRAQGCAVDISSEGELLVAREAGFSPEDIVFTGPGKGRSELKAALQGGCALVVLESVTEARRLSQVAEREGRCQDVLVRINPLYRTEQSCDISQSRDAARGQIQTICQNASKFGVDEEHAAEQLAVIMALPGLRLRGIHVFTESNVLVAADLAASWRNTLRLARELRDADLPVEIVDFGGGIGIAYDSETPPFDVIAFGKEVEGMLDEDEQPFQCIAEIGRYLVGGGGAYVAEVMDIKESRGETFVMLDGGIHHLLRVSPSMLDASRFLTVLGRAEAATREVTLTGRLPTALDVMCRGAQVPETLQVGDQLAIHHCGAYGFNHAISHFILHARPAEAGYQGGTLRSLRVRGRVEEAIAGQELSQERSSQNPRAKQGVSLGGAAAP